MLRFIHLALIFCSFSLALNAQNERYYRNVKFTPADSLRGQLSPLRTCYDVKHYFLDLFIQLEDKTIAGSNTIQFQAVTGFNVLQLDLFQNMSLDSVLFENRKLSFYRKHDAVFIDFGQMLEQGSQHQIQVFYHGQPIIAKNAPWDGGFTWAADDDGKPWVGVSCEGIGASLWWPNKDHLSDEPDSMRTRYTISDPSLYCVGNGNLLSDKLVPKGRSFDWHVSYPINNYNVTLNIANYVNFSDTHISTRWGKSLALDYYVLPYNLEKARKHFTQVKDVHRVFEKYFGPYPFWNDGYALVETPYLGMEHQGAIAYGNQYMRGYLGSQPDGLNFDFIIVHETGHEWFGNSLSCRDHAEMWLHEAFTTYTESVYVEEMYSYQDAMRYINFHGKYVTNKYPMVAPLGVNYDDFDTDIYYKGALMLNTLRHCINDDKLWWSIVYGFSTEFQIKPVDTKDFTEYIKLKTGQSYDLFFEQYLMHSKLPKLELEFKSKGKKTTMRYRWKADVKDFAMPMIFRTPKADVRLNVTDQWQEQTFKCSETDIKPAKDLFYVK